MARGRDRARRTAVDSALRLALRRSGQPRDLGGLRAQLRRAAVVAIVRVCIPGLALALTY